MQGLCCLDVRGLQAMDRVDRFIDDSPESPEVLARAREMIQATSASLERCDCLLARHARHWDLRRLALVDRNILRLAVLEFLSGRTPRKVVITEAIKLAGEFSTAESVSFINGVLDAVAKEIIRDAVDTQDNGKERKD